PRPPTPPLFPYTTLFRSLRPVGDPTTGGLRPKGDKLTPHGDGAPAPAALEPVVAAPEGAPLRLFGGVAPTARVGVALAGFGTLAVLILALGLATPGNNDPRP